MTGQGQDTTKGCADLQDAAQWWVGTDRTTTEWEKGEYNGAGHRATTAMLPPAWRVLNEKYVLSSLLCIFIIRTVRI
jgi:hypothetical protein